ncbi:MAG: archease [Candidatus Woesearchaeota archaeon]
MRESNFTNFEYLPKTADVRFRAFGKDFNELLRNCLRALINSMVDYKKIKKQKKKIIELRANSLEKLLIKFLEEIIFLMDAESFLAADLEKIDLKNNKDEFVLKALIVGDDNLKNYDFSLIVKAVTYNDFVFKKEKDNYVVEITLDV